MANGYGPPDPWRLGGNWGPHRVPSLLSPSSIDEEEGERRLREMELARMQAEARGRRVPANYRPTPAQPSLLQDALEAQSQRQDSTLGDWMNYSNVSGLRPADALPRHWQQERRAIDDPFIPTKDPIPARESRGRLDDVMYGITSAPVSRAHKYAGNALRMMGSPELLDSEKIRQLGRQATYRSREIQESVPETKTARTAQGIGEFGTTGLEYMGGGGAARGLLTGAVRRGVGAYASRGLGDKVAKSLARVARPVLKPQTRVGTVLSDMALYSPADIAYAASGDPGVGGLLGMMGAEGLSEWLGESKVRTGLADVLFGGVADATLRGIGAAYRGGQGPTPSAPSSLLTSSDVLPREPGTIIKGVSPHQPLSGPEARRLLTGAEPRPLLTPPTEPAGLLKPPVKPRVVKDAVIRQTPSQWGVERPQMQSALEPYPTQYAEEWESHRPVIPEPSSLAGNYTSPVMRAVQGGPKSATLEGWKDYLTRQKGLKRDEVDMVLTNIKGMQIDDEGVWPDGTHRVPPSLWRLPVSGYPIPRQDVEGAIKEMYGGLKVVEADAKMLGGAIGMHWAQVKPLERYMDELREAKGLEWHNPRHPRQLAEKYRSMAVGRHRRTEPDGSFSPDELEEAVRLEAEHLRQADLDRVRRNLRESSDTYSISVGNQRKGWLDEDGEPFTPYAFEITSDLPGIKNYTGSHFNNPGAIAHVRLRRTPQGVGKRRGDGLHPSSWVVDEIQSDAYQKLRDGAIRRNYFARLKEEAGRRFADEAQWGPGDLKKVERDTARKWLEEAGLGTDPQMRAATKRKLHAHVWKNTPQEVRGKMEDAEAVNIFGVNAAQLPFRQTEQWLRVAVSETLKRAAQNGIREVVFPTSAQINRVYSEGANPGGMYATVLQTIIKQVSKDLGATVKRMDIDKAENYLPSDMADWSDSPQVLRGKHGPDIGADPDPNTVVEISEDLGSRMRGEQPHRPVSTKMYGGAGVDLAGLLGATVEDDDPDEFGWRDVPSLLGAAALGRRAVATTGAGRTATARGRKVSAPMRRVIDKKLVRPNEMVGHFGVGRAVGDMEAFPAAINIEKDRGLRAWIEEEAPKKFPGFKANVFASAEEAEAIGKLDVTLSPYVINTLRDKVAVDHLVEMAQSLNPNGRMLVWMRGKELKALSTGKGKKPGEWTPTGPKGSGQGQQWRDVPDVEELVDAAARKSGHSLRITDVLEDTSGTLMVEVQRISPSPVPLKGIYGKSPLKKGVKASEYQPPDARTVATRKKDTREFLDWAEKNPQGIWVPAEREVFDRSLITPGEYSRPGVNTLPPISPKSTASAKEGGLLRQISSGSLRGLLDRQAKLGLRQGGETFYNLLPVEAFIESMSRPKNSFRDFAAATSASSAQNPVLREIASGSILLYAKANNISVLQAMEEYFRRYPEAKGFSRQFLSGWKTDTAPGGSHVDKWNKYLETGTIDPPGPASGSRKIPTYFRQKMGEEIPGATSDVHDQKAILWPTGNENFIENVTGGRYGLLSDVSVAGGKRLGINPEQYQGGRWIGGGPLTGLGSARGDYVQHLEDALLWTAIMAGKDTSPQGLRKLFEGVINGREFILPYYGKGSPVTRGGSLIKSLSGLGGIAAIWAQQKEAAEDS